MLATDVTQSISKMLPDGLRLNLPKDEQFKNYTQVKKVLINAGGKYSKNGFTFASDAAEVQQKLAGGEAINDKKKFQFFATPQALARRIVDMAELGGDDIVLEPSAGQGAILNEISKYACEFHAIELMPENARILEEKGYSALCADFLTVTREDMGGFDKIIANPPFTKNQDIDHIKHMYSLLTEGGKLVSIASKSWQHGSQKKQVGFREWLNDVDATVTELPEGDFKESGTNIATVIIEVTK